ncbi:MAG: F0F1 ATP synthase subunit gamma [Beijerinckiaceae bacterium]|nr:F0F1 ATP synthase subunit gamma [Beijerinckiaceae bacterium]
MTGRLADVSARIDGIHALGMVVNAMRGIAAARAQQARSQLSAVDSYTATIAAAIGRALALAPEAARGAGARSSRPALVLFCAEQGFAGAFSERILDAARASLPTAEIFLIGTRGVSVAAERGIAPGWNSAMPAHSGGIPKLADRIAEALYKPIATGEIDQLDAVFGEWRPGHGVHVERRHLFPLDTKAFPLPRGDGALVVNLAPDVLLSELTAAYLHAQLCDAALQAFAAENEARMEAMAAAHHQIERQLSELQARQRILRQEEITEEIIELAAGETASKTR